LLANEAVIFAKVAGNTTIEDDVPAKLKHVSAQIAIALQSYVAFSHGFALGGQQSGMSAITDISAGSSDLELAPAAPAAGSIATDRAIKSARMVRPMLMDQAYVNSRFLAAAVK
jgi:hypothetical protein